MEKCKVLPVKVDSEVLKFEAENKPLTLNALEDTYVVNGDSANGANTLLNSNFGNDEILHFKGNDGSGIHYRRVLLKFDISELSAREPARVELLLYGTGCQDAWGSTPAFVYAVEPDSWKQKEVTYNTIPKAGKLVGEAQVGMGYSRIDLSDYVKEQIALGNKVVSVLLAGDDSKPIHVQFASSRHPEALGPKLIASYSSCGYTVGIAANSDLEQVWDNAAKMVEEWFEDWAEITAKGDHAAEFVHEKEEEYAKLVDVTNTPKNPYKKHSTRTMDTIVGYEPVKDGEIELDEYGGCICDKKFNATGWFHVEERDGRLWTVDPLGNPFYRIAMVLIAPGASPNQQAKMLKKYGTRENWVELETAHLRDDLGYNSLGGWSSIGLLSKAKQPLALTHIVYFLSQYTRESGLNNSTGGNTTFVGGVMPVFDPEFESFSDRRAKEIVSPYANDPHVYGWMGDNELHAEFKLLDTYLMADSKNPCYAYSYTTAWTFLRSVTGKENVSVFDVTDEHRRLFRAMIYNRYFRVISAAIKKYAPNHMFLGSRFLPGCYRSEHVHRVSGKWCDVISLNYYGAWAPESELIQNIQKWSGRPFIITEWYAKGMDACTPESRLTNETGAGFTVRTQKDRGYFYHNYTLKLMECKGCAGFDWFQCWDNDPDNLKADLSNRNSNKGIYDNNCNEYTELTEEMKIVNKNCYKLIDFFDNDKTRSN